MELAGTRRRLRVPQQALPLPSTVLVTGSDAALNAALALAWLDFPSDFLAETGFTRAGGQSGPEPPGAGCHYIGPRFRWEVSGFWRTVAEEIVLGGVPSRLGGLEETIRLLGLNGLLERVPGELSGGETAKLILAAHLACRPRCLVLDRVLGELDVPTRAEVMGNLGAWVPQGIVMVIDDTVAAGFDREVATDGEEAAWSAGKRPEWDRRAPDSVPPRLTLECINPRAGDPGSGIRLEHFAARRAGRVFPALDWTASAGQLVLVKGANGSGKSSLLEALAGLLQSEGRIIAWRNGQPVAPDRLFAISPQDPLCDITELGIEQELALACADRGTVARVLDELEFPRTLLQAPLPEDAGLQKLTSVIAATLRGRAACLLDEPTLCLGRALRPIAERAILRYLKLGGIVLCSSHDFAFIQALRSHV